MDAIKEYFRIADRLEHEEITLEEYEKLCEPLRNVVEVVRCKDCEHRFKNKWFCCDGRCLDDEQFCSYGERREDDKG